MSQSAPVLPAEPQPPAPQLGPSQAADKNAQAAGFLAALKKAQDEFSGCAIPASVAPAHGGLASSVRGGIHTPADVAHMRAHAVHAFLVGEAFMRAPEPGDELARLFGAPAQA